jgi:hypothetical protein
MIGQTNEVKRNSSLGRNGAWLPPSIEVFGAKQPVRVKNGMRCHAGFIARAPTSIAAMVPFGIPTIEAEGSAVVLAVRRMEWKDQPRAAA